MTDLALGAEKKRLAVLLQECMLKQYIETRVSPKESAEEHKEELKRLDALKSVLSRRVKETDSVRYIHDTTKDIWDLSTEAADLFESLSPLLTTEEIKRLVTLQSREEKKIAAMPTTLERLDASKEMYAQFVTDLKAIETRFSEQGIAGMLPALKLSKHLHDRAYGYEEVSKALDSAQKVLDKTEAVMEKCINSVSRPAGMMFY
jgi:hypothetical protein